MENVNEQNVLSNMVLDEDGYEYDKVLMAKNLARTKGFVTGAAIVGACWLGSVLYKKYKNRNAVTVDVQTEPNND